MGRLEDAVAIDSKNIPRRDNMKLGIDLPWRAPVGTTGHRLLCVGIHFETRCVYYGEGICWKGHCTLRIFSTKSPWAKHITYISKTRFETFASIHPLWPTTRGLDFSIAVQHDFKFMQPFDFPWYLSGCGNSGIKTQSWRCMILSTAHDGTWCAPSLTEGRWQTSTWLLALATCRLLATVRCSPPCTRSHTETPVHARSMISRCMRA